MQPWTGFEDYLGGAGAREGRKPSYSTDERLAVEKSNSFVTCFVQITYG